ncbi:MAG: type II secretion system protein GspG [Planctomycetota bacterium]|nr:type II secretion system protein GspG [Planctomycetota bacterium]
MPLLLTLVLAFLLTPTAGAQDAKTPAELRAEVAKAFVEYLPYEISGKSEEDFGEVEFARIMAMLERLEAMVEQLPAVDQRMLEEGSLADYLEPLFERFEPEGLPLVEQYRERGRVSTTRHYLEGIQFGLELHLLEHGEYPSEEAGLGGLIAGRYIEADATRDGWDQAVHYRLLSPSEYRVDSPGPDGQRGTDDDWILTAEDGLVPGAAAKTSPAAGAAVQVETLIELLPGESFDSVVHGSNGTDPVLVVQGEGQTRFVRGGQELGAISADDEAIAFSDLDAFAYLSELGQRTVLVVGDEVVMLEDSWCEAEFLAGTETLIYGDGEELLCLQTGGEVLGRPAYDQHGELVAFRERRDEGYYVHTKPLVHGPYEWASAPTMLRGGERERLHFDLWDGEQTHVVIGERVVTCTWAGDPILSPDGEHYALFANFGGQPTEAFEELRDLVRDSWREPSPLDPPPAHQLFEGGVFRAVLDDVPGPEQLAVSDLAFKGNGDDTAILYRGQQLDGDWQVLIQSDELEGPTVMGKQVGPPLVDGSGVWSSYDFRDFQDRRWIRDPHGRIETGEVLTRHAGPDAGFAYVVEDDRLDQGRRILWFGNGGAEPWSSDVVQGHELLDWVGSPSRPVFRVYSEGKHGLVFGQGTHVVFDELLAPSLPHDFGDRSTFGQLAWYEGQPVLAVHHLDEERINVSNLEGRVTGCDPPLNLSGGRVAFLAHLGSEPLAYPQYGKGAGGQTCLVVYDDGEFLYNPSADRITGLTESEGGRLAYLATHGEQQRVEVHDGGPLVLGELMDTTDLYELDFLGEEPVYVTGGAAVEVAIGDARGPVADAIFQLEQLADGQRVRYGMSLGVEDFLVVGGTQLGPFESLWSIREVPDQDLLVFTTNEADWTRTSLHVISTRPGELGAAPLLHATFDQLESDFTHRDPSSLVYYASRDGEVQRLTLDLTALRSDD